MKKKLKAFAALAATLVMVISFSGCGDFDAATYVEGTLDACKTGTVSDELADISVESKEEIQEDIDEIYSTMADEMIDVFGDECVTDKTESLCEEYSKALMNTMKYEVSDDCEEKNGTYHVKVTAYPLDLSEFMDYMDGDFVNQWTEKVAGYSTQDEFLSAFYEAYIQEFVDYLKDTENLKYGESQEYTVKVSEDKDGYYEMDEEDLTNLLGALFAEDQLPEE